MPAHCDMIRLAALLCLLCAPVSAQTLCPTVSDNVAILGVIIVNAPHPVYGASYDLETSYLTVGYTNGVSQMLTGVPLRAVQTSGPVQWASVSFYPSALMQERSECPLLSETGSPLLWE